MLSEKVDGMQVDKLPTFEESACDPHVWIGRFESLATSKKWIRNRHEMMPVYLGNNEHEWYRDLPGDVKQHYELLKDAFLSEYSPSNATKFEAETRLRSQKQTPDMSVKTFIKQVRREARRIGLNEAGGVSIIRNNLLPAARCTITTTPTTYAQLLDTPVARGDIPITDDRYQQLLDLLVSKEAQIASLQQTTGGNNSSTPRYRQQRYDATQDRQHANQQPPVTGHRGQAGRQHGNVRQCRGCGGRCQARATCPAWGAQCRYCGVYNHFAKVCGNNPQASMYA